jgi:hypothetical protein
MDWREQYAALEACLAGGHPRAFWARKLTENGQSNICYYCPDCQRPVTQQVFRTRGPWVSPDRLWESQGIKPEQLPEIAGDVRYRLCRICRESKPCELHHVAPQAVFRALADLFPLVPLCRHCHVQVEQTWRKYLDNWAGAD